MTWPMACLVATLLFASSAPLAAGHAANVDEETAPFVLYAHRVSSVTRDASYPMDTTPPTAEAPQTTTCTPCEGDPYLELTFLTEPSTLPFDVELVAGRPGAFTFWVRGYQAQPGAGVPPGYVKAIHRVVAGADLVGEGRADRNVTTVDPTDLNATFDLRRSALPAGAVVQWTVRLSGAGNVYHSVAAPYGVSERYPFAVTLERIVPQSGVGLDLEADVTEAVASRRAIDVPFSLSNHGSRTTRATLATTGLPAGAIAEIRGPDGKPNSGTLSVAPASSLPFTLNVTGLPPGDHEVALLANATTGASDTLTFQIKVLPRPTPTTADRGTPAATLPALAAAIAFAAWRRRAGEAK